MGRHGNERGKRREIIRETLTSAGLTVAPVVVDAAAGLDPTNLPDTIPAKVAAVEELTHGHAAALPITPAVVALPTLLRDYTDARHVADESRVDQHPIVYGSMAYLAAFLAARLVVQHDYDRAQFWYGAALRHAEYAGDRVAMGWISGHAALVTWYRRETAAAGKHSPVRQFVPPAPCSRSLRGVPYRRYRATPTR